MYFLGETQEPLQLFYSCFVFLCTLFFLMYLYGRFYGQRRSTNKIPYSFSRSGTQMHICEPHECALGYMTAKGGIYMALKKKKGLKLKMTDDQDGNKLANLEVWRREDKFAFCYKYKDSERYLLFEEDGELKFTQMKQNTDAAIKGELKKWNYWFEIKNNGTSHDSIQTAVSQKYLHLEERERCATLNDMQTLESTFKIFRSESKCKVVGCTGVGDELSSNGQMANVVTTKKTLL